MPFITDDTLKSLLAGASALSSAAVLPTHWTTLAPKANTWAYRKILQVLLGRGFTQSVVDAWGAVEGASWNEQLGVAYGFWLAEKANPDRGRAAWEEVRELVEELTTLPIVVDGVVVYPTRGRISGGEYDTSDDRHTLDDEF